MNDHISAELRPTTFFFFADYNAATFELATSYLCSFSFNNTIITYETYTKLITPYLWS